MPSQGGVDAKKLHLEGVRVAEEDHAVFTMAAAAYDISLQDLLRPVLEAEANRLRKIPEIMTMLRSAAELRAREGGKLRRISLPDG